MPAKRPHTLFHEYENGHLLFPYSETSSLRFCEFCFENALPVLNKVLASDALKSQSKGGQQKIGNIVTAIEAENKCALCKFFVEVTQLRSPGSLFRTRTAPRSRGNDIYLVQDQDPWFHKIGISANIPSCPFAWLRIGSEVDQPLICITLQHKEHAESSRLVNHKLYPAQRNLLNAFNGSVNSRTIKGWLDKCAKCHAQCSQDTDVHLPDLKVLDVKTRQLTPYIKGERYVALSYVWGRGASQQAVLFGDALRRSQNTQAFGNGMTLPSNLPQTIEDALLIADELGVKYFWVDVFCIDQDNEIEKQVQIEAMDQIYAAAWLTIVSVDGPGADYGLPGTSRPLLKTRQPNVQVPFGCLMATYVHSLWEHNGVSAWDSRAWTLQERLLSHRCLFFADTYYAMSCKEEQFHDLVNVNIDVPEIRLGQQESYFREDGSSVDLDSEDWSFEQYGNLVSVFTSRQITDQNDIQNACWGSLNRITSRTGVPFHHGLPMKHDMMLDSLLWIPHYRHVLTRRPGFPSWSWLGWLGRCEYAYWLHFRHTEKCRHKLPDSRRRHMKETQFEALHGRKEASIIHDSQLTAPVIQLRTKVRIFDVRHLRTPGMSYHPSPSKPKEQSIGNHWALIKHDKSELLNEVSEYQDFENTTIAFRVDRLESNELIRQKQKANLIFIKYWPYIWDTKKVLLHLVSALVVYKDKNGSYNRLASVILPADEWLEGDLREITVTIV